MMNLKRAPAIVLILISICPLAASAEQGSSFFYSPAELNWIDCKEKEWRAGKISSLSESYLFKEPCTYAVFRPALVDPDKDLWQAYLNDDLQSGLQYSDRNVLADAKASKNFYNRAAFKYVLNDYGEARADLNTCLKLWYNEFGDLGPHQADERRLAIEKLDRKVCQALLHFSVAEGKGAFEKEVDIQNSPRGCHFPFFKPALIDAEVDLCLAYLNDDPEEGIKQLDMAICKDSESISSCYNRAAFKYLAKDFSGARSDLNTCLMLRLKELNSIDAIEADVRRFAIEELDRNISQALLFWKK